jgi:hypothetical protein
VGRRPRRLGCGGRRSVSRNCAVTSPRACLHRRGGAASPDSCCAISLHDAQDGPASAGLPFRGWSRFALGSPWFSQQRASRLRVMRHLGWYTVRNTRAASRCSRIIRLLRSNPEFTACESELGKCFRVHLQGRWVEFWCFMHISRIGRINAFHFVGYWSERMLRCVSNDQVICVSLS